MRDRVTATRGGGARCAVRSCRTCAITITCISRESTLARSAPPFTRVATRCSRTRVPSTRTRNSVRAATHGCGSSATIPLEKKKKKKKKKHYQPPTNALSRLLLTKRETIVYMYIENHVPSRKTLHLGKTQMIYRSDVLGYSVLWKDSSLVPSIVLSNSCFLNLLRWTDVPRTLRILRPKI